MHKKWLTKIGSNIFCDINSGSEEVKSCLLISPQAYNDGKYVSGIKNVAKF